MNGLTPIVVSGALVAVLVGYVFLRTPTRDWVKYLMVAGLLGASTFSAGVVMDLLGYAVATRLPDRARMLGYHVVIEDFQKKRIDIWLSEDKTRLYAIPYTKESEKKLKDLMARGKGGGTMILRRGKGMENPPFETDILMPNQEVPKEEDGPPTPQAPVPWGSGA